MISTCVREGKAERRIPLNCSQRLNCPKLPALIQVSLDLQRGTPSSACTDLVWPLPASPYTPGSSNCTWDRAHWRQRAFYWNSRCPARALPPTGWLHCFHCDLKHGERKCAEQSDWPASQPPSQVSGTRGFRRHDSQMVDKGISEKWSPMSQGRGAQSDPFRPMPAGTHALADPSMNLYRSGPPTPTSRRSTSLQPSSPDCLKSLFSLGWSKLSLSFRCGVLRYWQPKRP